MLSGKSCTFTRYVRGDPLPMKPMPVIIATCVVAIPVLVLAIQGARSRRHPPASLGPAREGLTACPSRPNCVESSDAAGQRAHAPLRFAGPPDEARRHLHAALEGFPRVRVVTDEWPYVHAEFRSSWLGFVDDVEFLADDDAGRIDFRSASRVGYYDLGVNRRRMEEFRRRFEAIEGSSGRLTSP
jgi:uncharacterized protein (DUF1499 family)